MRWIGALAVGIPLFPTIAGAATPQSCPAPVDLHDGWQTAAPAKEGLDPKLICAIGPTLEKMTGADANGVLVVRHGVLVYEHYFAGWDEQGLLRPPAYEPHDANTLHDLHSITKSVVAILIGIAFDRGWLKNIDAPVFSCFPRYADLRTSGKDRITLRDLFTMTSGLAWPELSIPYGTASNPWGRMFASPDPYPFVLEQPLAATPGTV